MDAACMHGRITVRNLVPPSRTTPISTEFFFCRANTEPLTKNFFFCPHPQASGFKSRTPQKWFRYSSSSFPAPSVFIITTTRHTTSTSTSPLLYTAVADVMADVAKTTTLFSAAHLLDRVLTRLCEYLDSANFV
jgi:hypothetical protein